MSEKSLPKMRTRRGGCHGNKIMFYVNLGGRVGFHRYRWWEENGAIGREGDFPEKHTGRCQNGVQKPGQIIRYSNAQADSAWSGHVSLSAREVRCSCRTARPSLRRQRLLRWQRGRVRGSSTSQCQGLAKQKARLVRKSGVEQLWIETVLAIDLLCFLLLFFFF